MGDWWYIMTGWEWDAKEGPEKEGDLEGEGRAGEEGVAVVAAAAKGGKSGMGKLEGGGALLNAGPAHLVEGGEGPLSLGGEEPSREKEGVLSTKRFSWKLV